VSGINRIPSGLLGFLGIKNGGRYPQQLSDVLMPTVNMAPWYIQTNIQSRRATPVNVTAVGFTSYLQVPAGELWAITAAQWNSNAVLGAGVSLRGFVAAAQIDGVGFAGAALGPYAAMTAGEVFVSGSTLQNPLILPPLTEVGFFASLVTAGPVAGALQLWYTRLEA
jgi:hypothetical protein